MSDGVEWAVHCCTVLGMIPAGDTLPAARLAEFHAVPPAYLAKHLQALSAAGVLESVPGARGGYRLARSPKDVSLLDIVEAVEGTEPAFQCTEIRRRGPAAVAARHYSPLCTIARAMADAEDAWRASLRSRTVADLLGALATEVSPQSAVKAAAWFQEVKR